MKVITSNPVLFNNTHLSDEDKYVPFDGDEMLSYASGKGKSKTKGTKLKSFGGKVKNFGQSSGITDFLKGKITDKLGTNQNNTQVNNDYTPTSPVVEEKPPMSMTKKIVIGVSIAAVAGIIIYFATRKKKVAAPVAKS
jgi:hypothetical protein